MRTLLNILGVGVFFAIWTNLILNLKKLYFQNIPAPANTRSVREQERIHEDEAFPGWEAMPLVTSGLEPSSTWTHGVLHSRELQMELIGSTDYSSTTRREQGAVGHHQYEKQTKK